MRQIVLDTETTGLTATEGHRIIEVGCVELVNRRHTGRHFHQYVNPDRDIEAGAVAVHGLSRERLATAPRFAEIAAALLEFIGGAELIIHNAEFDVAFLDMELALLANPANVRAICRVLDTLMLARERHPGQRNNLDALCKRYEVDNSHRELHGALLDARLLADVYLAMTGGQSVLALDDAGRERSAISDETTPSAGPIRIARSPEPLRVIAATALELAAHAQLALLLNKASGGRCIWLAQAAAVQQA